MRTGWSRIFGGFKGILFVLALCVGIFLHFFTQNIIKQLREEARSLVTFYAHMYARVADLETSEDLSFIFDEIILRTHFPIIQTDVNKVPVGWKGISVDTNDRSEEALQKVSELVRRLDRQIDPIPVIYQGMVLNYLYYSDSRLIQQLQWLPYIEVGIIGLFILIGFVGYANLKRSEQRHIWVGMAKETAHQLGTPLSSLMGWVEVMRSDKKTNNKQITDEIERDLQRLQKVTQRFSQIGSKSILKKTDPGPVLMEVMEYIQRRAPQMGRRVQIKHDFQTVSEVNLNTDLFQWVLENLMKNSLDAMDKESGEIQLRLCAGNRKKVFVDVRDNGKGMDKKQIKKVFKPGYSTKKRGWGLGLTLAKRIVEEYHGGKLYVKDSRPGEGTVIRIELKV
jgi:signal transduction histidine kinase